jgi:hypothetical protein
MQSTSRQDETHLFLGYIQTLRFSSQRSLEVLCARLGDATSGAPVEVERDGGRRWIERCNQQLTDAGRRAVSPDPAVATCNEIGDAGEESIAGVLPVAVTPAYFDWVLLPLSSPRLEQRPRLLSPPSPDAPFAIQMSRQNSENMTAVMPAGGPRVYLDSVFLFPSPGLSGVCCLFPLRHLHLWLAFRCLGTTLPAVTCSGTRCLGKTLPSSRLTRQPDEARRRRSLVATLVAATDTSVSSFWTPTRRIKSRRPSSPVTGRRHLHLSK